MRVAITGATGNVGTSLIEALGEEAEVESIVGLTRRLSSWEPPKTTWVSAETHSTNLAPHFANVVGSEPR